MGEVEVISEKEVLLSGHVKTYSTRKGFGFITSDELASICGDIFVYNTHLVGRIGLIPGEKVEFVLFYDPVTLRPQARNVRVLEATAGEQVDSVPSPEQLRKLQMIKDEALKAAADRGVSGTPQTASSPVGLNTAPGAGMKQQQAQQDAQAQKIRQAQEDAQRKVRGENLLLQELEWNSHRTETNPMFYPPSSTMAYPSEQNQIPKSLIPIGSEVTIVDFPIRQINGQKGVVKSFDESSLRYKVEVTLIEDNKKESKVQEFLMPRSKLKIETLTLNFEKGEKDMRQKQDAAKEILTKAMAGAPASKVNPQTAAVLDRFADPGPTPQQQAAAAHAQHQQAAYVAAKGMQDLQQQAWQQQMMLKGKAVAAAKGQLPFNPALGGKDILAMKGKGFMAGMQPGMPGMQPIQHGMQPMQPGMQPMQPGMQPQQPAQPPAQQQATQPSAQQYPQGKGRDPAQAGFDGKGGKPFEGKGSQPERKGASPPAEKPAEKEEEKQELSVEEVSGSAGKQWKVREGSKDFADAIVREAAEMSSMEIKRLVPGDRCVQAGPMRRVDPGVVRMPIKPSGWVTVHARQIGGPTFLELVSESELLAEREAPKQDYGDVPGLDIEACTYPLAFLLRFKLVAPILEDSHPIKGIQVIRLAEGRKHRGDKKDKRDRREDRGEPGDRDERRQDREERRQEREERRQEREERRGGDRDQRRGDRRGDREERRGDREERREDRNDRRRDDQGTTKPPNEDEQNDDYNGYNNWYDGWYDGYDNRKGNNNKGSGKGNSKGSVGKGKNSKGDGKKGSKDKDGNSGRKDDAYNNRKGGDDWKENRKGDENAGKGTGRENGGNAGKGAAEKHQSNNTTTDSSTGSPHVPKQAEEVKTSAPEEAVVQGSVADCAQQ